jgi:hypothetical protein
MWYEPHDLPADFYCLTCRHKFDEEELARHKEEQKMRELTKAVNKAGRDKGPALATISDLWIELVDQFGGVDQVAALYKQQLMRAASTHNGAGSSRVLSACASLARICAMSSQHESANTPVGRMTDEQINQELVRMLRQLPLDQRRKLLDVSETTDVEHRTIAAD